jgi:hypothetical protein
MRLAVIFSLGMAAFRLFDSLPQGMRLVQQSVRSAYFFGGMTVQAQSK